MCGKSYASPQRLIAHRKRQSLCNFGLCIEHPHLSQIFDQEAHRERLLNDVVARERQGAAETSSPVLRNIPNATEGSGEDNYTKAIMVSGVVSGIAVGALISSSNSWPTGGPANALGGAFLGVIVGFVTGPLVAAWLLGKWQEPK
jgi:hypothetical protein